LPTKTAQDTPHDNQQLQRTFYQRDTDVSGTAVFGPIDQLGWPSSMTVRPM